MKLLVCTNCVSIHSLNPNGSWTICDCGKSRACWENPQRGTVIVRGVRSYIRILGMNNQFLLAAMEGPSSKDIVDSGGTSAWWKALHDHATDAKGYIFDKSLRSCWACLFQVGETGDVRYEETPPLPPPPGPPEPPLPPKHRPMG